MKKLLFVVLTVLFSTAAYADFTNYDVLNMSILQTDKTTFDLEVSNSYVVVPNGGKFLSTPFCSTLSDAAQSRMLAVLLAAKVGNKSFKVGLKETEVRNPVTFAVVTEGCIQSVSL